MRAIMTKLVPYLCFSLFCILISATSHAGFFDDLKKEAKKLEQKVKDSTEEIIREKKEKPEKKNLAKEEKQKKKKEASKKKQAERDKKKADKKAKKIKDEEAEWEAAVAEEKAKKAKKQVAKAEIELYKDDIDEAVKKNQQAYQLAIKKDSAERVATHDHKSQDWHIAHKGVGPFSKALYDYDVGGLSLGMKISAIEKYLVSNGYKRISRKITNGGPKYVYKKERDKNVSTVEILAVGFDDKPNVIIADLHNPDGEGKIAEEKIRLLNAFSGSCKVDRSKVYCLKYTDTNEVSIAATFLHRRSSNIQYQIKNTPSKNAK